MTVPGHGGAGPAIASAGSKDDEDHPAPDQQWSNCIRCGVASRSEDRAASPPSIQHRSNSSGSPANRVRSRFVPGWGRATVEPDSRESFRHGDRERTLREATAVLLVVEQSTATAGARGSLRSTAREATRSARAGYESFPSRTAFFGTQGILPTSSRRTGFKGPRPVRRPRLIANGGPTEVVLEPHRGGIHVASPVPAAGPARTDRSTTFDGLETAAPSAPASGRTERRERNSTSSRIIANRCRRPVWEPWSTIPYQSLSVGQAVPDTLSLFSSVRLCLTVFYSFPTFTPHHRSPSHSRVGHRPTRRSSGERSGWTFRGPEAVNTSNSTTRNLNQPAVFRGISNRANGMRPRASHDLARRLRARERGGHCGSHRNCPATGRASAADRSDQAKSPGCPRRGDGGDRRPFRGSSRPGEPCRVRVPRGMLCVGSTSGWTAWPGIPASSETPSSASSGRRSKRPRAT